MRGKWSIMILQLSDVPCCPSRSLSLVLTNLFTQVIMGRRTWILLFRWPKPQCVNVSRLQTNVHLLSQKLLKVYSCMNSVASRASMVLEERKGQRLVNSNETGQSTSFRRWSMNWWHPGENVRKVTERRFVLWTSVRTCGCLTKWRTVLVKVKGPVTHGCLATGLLLTGTQRAVSTDVIPPRGDLRWGARTAAGCGCAFMWPGLWQSLRGQSRKEEPLGHCLGGSTLLTLLSTLPADP